MAPKTPHHALLTRSLACSLTRSLARCPSLFAAANLHTSIVVSNTHIHSVATRAKKAYPPPPPCFALESAQLACARIYEMNTQRYKMFAMSPPRSPPPSPLLERALLQSTALKANKNNCRSRIVAAALRSSSRYRRGDCCGGRS